MPSSTNKYNWKLNIFIYFCIVQLFLLQTKKSIHTGFSNNIILTVVLPYTRCTLYIPLGSWAICIESKTERQSVLDICSIKFLQVPSQLMHRNHCTLKDNMLIAVLLCVADSRLASSVCTSRGNLARRENTIMQDSKSCLFKRAGPRLCKQRVWARARLNIQSETSISCIESYSKSCLQKITGLNHWAIWNYYVWNMNACIGRKWACRSCCC